MRKLTISNKISEISVIWSAVLVSFDQAAGPVSSLLWAGMGIYPIWAQTGPVRTLGRQAHRSCDRREETYVTDFHVEE
jgi:hypothetical protein